VKPLLVNYIHNPVQETGSSIYSHVGTWVDTVFMDGPLKRDKVMAIIVTVTGDIIHIPTSQIRVRASQSGITVDFEHNRRSR
jgi:hypothetical protein